MLKNDLTALGIKDDSWHQKALDRSRWIDIWSKCSCYQQDQQINQINSILCSVCHRVSDMNVIRHVTSASLRDNYRYKNKLGQCTSCQR